MSLKCLPALTEGIIDMPKFDNISNNRILF